MHPEYISFYGGQRKASETINQKKVDLSKALNIGEYGKWQQHQMTNVCPLIR